MPFVPCGMDVVIGRLIGSGLQIMLKWSWSFSCSLCLSLKNLSWSNSGPQLSFNLQFSVTWLKTEGANFSFWSKINMISIISIKWWLCFPFFGRTMQTWLMSAYQPRFPSINHSKWLELVHLCHDGVLWLQFQRWHLHCILTQPSESILLEYNESCPCGVDYY